jgi:hypothetical protein
VITESVPVPSTYPWAPDSTYRFSTPAAVFGGKNSNEQNGCPFLVACYGSSDRYLIPVSLSA